jgi:DNA-3-methyladenine glycosylase
MVDAMSKPPLLARGFYQRPTEVVARELLGKLLVRQSPEGAVTVRLTEVEAYLGVDDAACHTFGGRRTARTETMWGEAGHAYVYLVYGLHSCLNVVTVGRGRPEAVLVRGGVVEGGLELARARRGVKVGERALVDGPGKLCQALAVSRADDGADLCAPASGLVIRDDGLRVGERSVRRLPRVGVAYAGAAAAWPLRFVLS